MMEQIREVMTPEQAAEYLQVNRETIYRYIRQAVTAKDVHMATEPCAKWTSRLYHFCVHGQMTRNHTHDLLWQPMTEHDVTVVLVVW